MWRDAAIAAPSPKAGQITQRRHILDRRVAAVFEQTALPLAATADARGRVGRIRRF
jgi:hypothetical protein